MNKKLYAVQAFVKPKPTGNMVWSGKSFKGIVSEKSPAKAKEKVICYLADAIKSNKVDIQKEDITIKKCTLFNDFAIK